MRERKLPWDSASPPERTATTSGPLLLAVLVSVALAFVGWQLHFGAYLRLPARHAKCTDAVIVLPSGDRKLVTRCAPR
jgi:hypothetical protein